jgi:hypothetical protein
MSDSTDSNSSQLSQQEYMQKTNREMVAEWAIDVDQDPLAIPLDKLDPAHPLLFEANRMLPYFERLRAEDPVHYCAEASSARTGR